MSMHADGKTYVGSFEVTACTPGRVVGQKQTESTVMEGGKFEVTFNPWFTFELTCVFCSMVVTYSDSGTFGIIKDGGPRVPRKCTHDKKGFDLYVIGAMEILSFAMGD